MRLGVPVDGDPWAIAEIAERVATEKRIGEAEKDGSSGLFLGSDGVPRQIRRFEDPARALTVAVTNRAYRELGFDAPISALVRRDGRVVAVANEIVENRGPLGHGRRLTTGRAREAVRGYVADVWLANPAAADPDMKPLVATANKRDGVARLDQSGALLSVARRQREAGQAPSAIPEWDDFADPETHPGYARLFDAAGLGGPDDLGRRALLQIAKIRKLGQRTRDFADLVPVVAGVPEADRTAILTALRDRARLLERHVAPRVRAALREGRKRAVGPHQTLFLRELGPDFVGLMKGVNERLASGAPRLNLTEAELVSIYAYTTRGHSWSGVALNSALRDADERIRASAYNYRNTLLDALAKLPDHREEVYRGTNLRPDDLAKHQVDNTVLYAAFTSTSATAPYDGPNRFVIQSKHGKCIQPYSAYATEHEVLFAAGTRFLVVRRVNDGDFIQIGLEELD